VDIIDYDQFDRETLKKMLTDIPLELKKRDQKMKQELRTRMQKLAEEAGYSLDEVVGNNKAKPATKKAPAKYVSPNDPNLTWAGRGRQPLWVVAELESGKTLDDLKIS